jgi:integrase
LKREKSLGAKAAGITVVEDKPEIAPGTNLRETVVEYLEEVAVHKSKKTFAAYSLTLNLFWKRARRRTSKTLAARLLQFFLFTGAREQEVQYATWRDVDLDAKTFAVREKLDFGFTRKDKEEGAVPIPDSLVELLRARSHRFPNSRLIFTNSQGNPNGHFLRILNRLSMRAGLNCGTVTTVPVSLLSGNQISLTQISSNRTVRSLEENPWSVDCESMPS